MKTRAERFFDAWYWQKAKMSRDDWIFIGILIISCIAGFDLGLGIGFLITK